MDIQVVHTYVLFKNHFGAIFGRFFTSIESGPSPRVLRVHSQIPIHMKDGPHSEVVGRM